MSQVFSISLGSMSKNFLNYFRSSMKIKVFMNVTCHDLQKDAVDLRPSFPYTML